MITQNIQIVTQHSSMMQQYIQIFLTLIVIVGILYFVYYVLTKLPGNGIKKMKNKRINFLEQMFLSPGVVVYLISVDEQNFLMGVSSKSINFIQPIKGNADFATVLKEKEEEVKSSVIIKNKAKINTKDSKDGSS